jgi:hypothetical protein
LTLVDHFYFIKNTPLESKSDPAVTLERAARTLEPATAGA